ncbi:Vacuolar protein 8 [Coemansia spiralis]|uniref:Vacuolar protein 8 n=2 Tax=Coemansia TaxID=4863 RepID=A0A9W8G8P9_9FUNG|nr:armadillo-type protein [Coemansia spiralis]KAJ1990049.1 Vacuolar protein 8 [Coemansia umbellata]KAJ2622150.1 Vacuolar protein 8 [Coemansia sp. RSA 1358]KAJ2678361.1 Vacuolar protein 8 [Coemansia spiralis]
MGVTCSSLLPSPCCRLNDESPNREQEPLLADKERQAVNMLVDLFERRASISFYEGEPLKALSTLAYSDVYHLQLSAATAFSEISEMDTRPVSREALEPVLYLLQSPHIDVQHGASAALGNLAVNVENKLLIVRMGGLEPLIRQMLSPNIDAQINSVGCITNLATAEENKMRIAKSGALLPLTRLARSRDVRVQRNAAGALLNMTHSAEHRQQLIGAGAVPVLVELLASEDPELQYYATTALSNIAVDESGRRLLWETQPVLVDALLRFVETSTIKVQCQAILTLRNLASDDQYQMQIVEKGGLDVLLPLLQSEYDPLVISVSACLRNLSIHPQNEEPILHSGVLPSLVSLITQSGNEEVQCHVVSALRNLVANNDADKMPFVESGLFEHIRAVLSDPNTSDVVLGEMVAALSVFVLDESLWVYVLEGGFLELLIPLTRAESYELQCNTCAIISTLATKGSEASDRLIAVWDKPAGGLQSYLAAFLAVDVGMEPMLRSVALWTVSMLLESDSPELVRLVISHPSIIRNIEKIASVGVEASEGDGRNSAYMSSGLRNSQAFGSDGFDGEDIDESDDDIYNRIETLAQDIIAVVHNLEY